MFEEDDLYGGYDTPRESRLTGSDNGANPFTAGGFNPPGTSSMMSSSTAFPSNSALRSSAVRTSTALGTSYGGSQGRPLTSHRGAGFSSSPQRKDALQGRKGAATSVLGKKTDTNPEEQAKEMEKKVHELLEESCAFAAKSQNHDALEKATECKKRNAALSRFREQNNAADQINMDLTFAVEFHLAHMYHANKLYQEALNQYNMIVKSKQMQQQQPQQPTGRLRVNMGNIYFEQKKYSNAIKLYRMALDQIPAAAKEIRYRIMCNIGLAFMRMGQYQDAQQAFSNLMDNTADLQTAYNMVIVSYALGDAEKMKSTFRRLLDLPGYEQGEEGDSDDEDDLNNVVYDDGLRDELKKRRSQHQRYILNAAQLISEKIDRTGFAAGFDWCVNQLREAGNQKLANEVELAKATKFLARKDFGAAISVFKEFEKKEHNLKARAATNLSFLYFCEGDHEAADKYSELALRSDKYNARAFVNKGNVLFERGDLEGAKVAYTEAISIEPYCVEAKYNLGLVLMRTGAFDAAKTTFKKLHNFLPDNVEVMYQLASCYEAEGDFKSAVKWFDMVSSLLPNDPAVLAKLGAIHARFEDEARALQYFQESHRVYPVNMDVLSWLGAFHVKNEVYEKAIPYFDLASTVQPKEVKWALMVASCYRRIGAIPKALAKYKSIHSNHPENAECLRYLVHICTDLGRRDEAQEYLGKLRKAERVQATTMVADQQQAPLPPRPLDPSLLGKAVTTVPEMEDEPIEFRKPATNVRKAVIKETTSRAVEDDWNNEELGDDLLPM